MKDSNSLETLKDIIKSANVAMLVTINEEHRIVARPMKLQEVEFDGDLWFLTMKDTEKYDEIKQNDHVNVIIADKSFASISGTAEIVNDKDKIKEFWNKAYQVMFNMDYTDPRITLIKVHAETAEYWDTGGTIKSAINFAKKMFDKDDDDEDDSNQTITL